MFVYILAKINICADAETHWNDTLSRLEFIFLHYSGKKVNIKEKQYFVEFFSKKS
jgi:hypothetical protein